MKREKRKVPAWEWMVALVGLILIVFVVGALIWEGVRGLRNPPLIELRVKKTVPQGSGELVLIEVYNRGDEVASDLKVRGSLRAGTNVLEAREITIDFVPRDSRKVVGLFFTQPTAGHDLKLEPIGFVAP